MLVGGQGHCWSGDERSPDPSEAVERVGELGCPRPAGVDSDLGAALSVDQPGGDVQQPVAQQFRFGLGEVASRRVVWVQAIRSAAVSASCSQVWLIWNSRDGSR